MLNVESMLNKMLDHQKSQIDVLTSKIDNISHLPDSIRQMENKIVNLEAKIDSFQKSLSDVLHLESRLLHKFDERYVKKDELRANFKLALDEHEERRLLILSKRSVVLSNIVQFIQVALPILLVIGYVYHMYVSR